MKGRILTPTPTIAAMPVATSPVRPISRRRWDDSERAGSGGPVIVGDGGSGLRFRWGSRWLVAPWRPRFCILPRLANRDSSPRAYLLLLERYNGGRRSSGRLAARIVRTH